MNPVFIDNIIVYTDTEKGKRTSVIFKSNYQEITREVADNFNAFYDEIMGICMIASNFCKYEPINNERFTFSGVISNMNAVRKISSQK